MAFPICAIDLVFVAKDHVPINCDHQTNRFERAICAADCSMQRGNRMIMEPTSCNKIERSLVTREPTPSILAIGQSTIVAPRRRRSGSAYQGVHSGVDHAMRRISRFFDVGWLDGFGEARSAAS